MRTFLITGVRAPISLDFCRSFQKFGVRVILADALKFPISRWSNTVSTYYELPSPKHHTTEFIAKIQTIIQQEAVTDILPLCEEAFYLSIHRDELNCMVWVDKIETMNLLHNKYLFSTETSLPTVKSQLVSEFTDWNNSINYVFKPIYSRFANATIIGKAIDKLTIPEKEQNQWIVQKRIKGKEICTYSIWNNGRLKSYACYQPTYRAGKGAGIFFRPTNHQATFELIKAFGEEVNYTGQMSFDVMIDDMNNPHFLECNPRGTSGAHLLDEQLAASFFESPIVFQSEQDYALKYAMVIFHFFRNFSREVQQAKDVVYSSKDPLPFLMQWLSFVEIIFIWVKTQKKSLLKATTENIEWNGN